jgi:hypothetical protein
MRSLLRPIAAVCLLALTPFGAGCGLMFGGTRQSIRATSSPEGAIVTTTPATVDYKTPTTLNLERKNSYVLEFSMPGYTSQKVEFQRSIRGGIVVLDILAGLLGVIIDAATGAWYKLSPEMTSVTLTKTDPTVAGPNTITVTFGTVGTRESKDGAVRVKSSAPGVKVVATPK